MAEEKKDSVYPVKSLHDFLSELDREWSRFRNGSLISLVSSGILFLIVVAIILRTRHLGLGLLDFAFLVLAGVFLGYSIYAMYRQYRFFNRWERRIGLLLHLEEQMLAEKLDETNS
jgi:O-antigen/teichoic acid export membrane protein